MGKKRWVQEVMGTRKKCKEYGTEGREQSYIKRVRKASLRQGRFSKDTTEVKREAVWLPKERAFPLKWRWAQCEPREASMLEQGKHGEEEMDPRANRGQIV